MAAGDGRGRERSRVVEEGDMEGRDMRGLGLGPGSMCMSSFVRIMVVSSFRILLAMASSSSSLMSLFEMELSVS